MLTVFTDMSGFPNSHVRVYAINLIWLALAASAGLANAAMLQGEVVGIVDGDTLTLLVDQTPHKIRLAAIDCPEAGQPWGSRARQALADKVFRKQVVVEVIDKDRYGRLVGTVRLDGRDINREMVSEGHAWAYRQYLHDNSLLELEAEAKSAGIGLWSLAEAVPPWQWRRGGAAASESGTLPASAGLAEPSEDGARCVIKGNISADGKKIYHLPGQRYYSRTKISENKGERWFCSEEQAKEAGWRRARV